jgi:hypothetical protein
MTDKLIAAICVFAGAQFMADGQPALAVAAFTAAAVMAMEIIAAQRGRV